MATRQPKTKSAAAVVLKDDYAAERERREWWVCAENQVKCMTGYSCKPNNPNQWWCPEVGYTLTEGYHLFETEYAALDHEIAVTVKEIAAEQKRLDELRARRTRAQES